MKLLHELYKHLDKPNTYARVLFADFSGVFSTFQPRLMNKEVRAMSVNQTVISWIDRFLTERPQDVEVGEVGARGLFLAYEEFG